MPAWPCAKIAAWSFSSFDGSAFEYFLTRSTHFWRPATAAGCESWADPLVALPDVDPAAVGLRPRHGGEPVHRHVDRAELGALVVGLQLVGRLEEVVVGLRHLDLRLLEEVGAVDQDASTGVVRHAIGLAVELTGARQALQPGVGVLELALVQWAKPPLYTYLANSVLPSSMTSGTSVPDRVASSLV